MRKAYMYKRTLDWIIGYMLEKGYPPTVREIGEGLGYGSTSTVFNHLNHMQELGMLHYRKDSPRTITIPGMCYVRKERGQEDGRTGTGSGTA